MTEEQLKVSKKYTIIKMKHLIDGKIKHISHLDSDIGAQDYTICGLGVSDSTLEFEDCKMIKMIKGGVITCPQCIKIIKWYKEI